MLYCENPLIIKYGGHNDQLSQQHWGMDRFRIRALVNCLNYVELTETDYAAARKILQNKLDVLLKGAQKHKNHELIKEFSPLQRKYTQAKPSNYVL